jgi:FkbM family methyltransferase
MAAKAHHPGIVVEANIGGKSIFFFVVNMTDSIQNHHLNGEFYEAQELQIIARHFKRGGVFVDIGSNVGNHVIFVEKFLEPDAVIPVELNPEAIRLFRINAALNGLKADTSFLGVGVSDEERRVVIEIPPNNLGGARTLPRADGGFRLVPGDHLFANLQIDFIKIDVEGGEIEALHGLEETIAANRPLMFVEVDDTNAEKFMGWLASHQYGVVERFRRYRVNENFLISPV